MSGAKGAGHIVGFLNRNRAAAASVFLVIALIHGVPAMAAASTIRLDDWSFTDFAQRAHHILPNDIPDTAWRPLAPGLLRPADAGFGLVWLRATLPDTPYRFPSFYVEFPPPLTRIAIDTSEIAVMRMSENAPDSRAALPPPWPLQILAVRGQRLYLQVSLAEGRPGIDPRRLAYGERAELVRKLVEDHLDRIFLGVLFVLGGLLSLLVKAVYRKEAFLLDVGILSLSSGAFVLLQSPIVLGLLDWGHDGGTTAMLFAMWVLPVGFVGMVDELTGKSHWRLHRALLFWHLALASLGLGASLLIDPVWSFRTANIFYITILLEVPAIALIVFRHARRGGNETRIFSAGYLFVAFFGVHDSWMGYREAVLGKPGHFLGFHWGMLFFLIAVLFVVIQRFFRTRDEIVAAARAAEEMNVALRRFVPAPFLEFLGHKSLVDVRLGDSEEAEMTVLFADMRQFTSFSEGMSPADNFRFVNAFLGRVGPLIRRHGGFVDKYIGDAIMALFPRRPDDALLSALEMMRVVAEYGAERRGQGRAVFEVGCGIHFGPVVLGTIGEPERMDGTVISDTVNVAARLQELSKGAGGSIIVSAEARARLENPGEFQFGPGETIRLRGRTRELGYAALLSGGVASGPG